MTLLLSGSPRTWTPEQVGDLIVRPVTSASVAMTATKTVPTDPSVTSFGVPLVTGDPVAKAVAEGAEITPSDIQLGEDRDVFHKYAGLSIISRETAEDSSPAVADVIGQRLANDIARAIDADFFGTRAGNNTIPLKGLGNVADATQVAAAAWKDADPFTEAVYRAQEAGATITSFVTSPAVALKLAQLKESTTSNRDLLQPDPTAPAVRMIDGVPLLISPAVADGIVWGLPNDGRVLLPIRQDVDLVRDESAFFTSDRVAIRATMRITALFSHPAAIVKITGPATAGGSGK